MTKTTAVATTERPKSVTLDMADRFGMDAGAFEATLRQTVFREGSREEFAAFLLVAKNYNLNPLVKEIYAFKAKGGGIVPVVSIDGWVSLCNSHPQFDGMAFEDLHDPDGKLYAITCTIYRRDRSHPTIVTEYLEECVRATEPWKMKHRMLRHKAMIQCARYAFGFSGIYDQDEAERIEIVTPQALPKLTAGFAEPEGSSPAAGAAHAAHDATKTENAPDASQDAAHEAEFEDIAEDEGFPGDRPTSTASVPSADAGPASSDSASNASGDLAEETSSQAPADELSESGEKEPDGTTASPDEIYVYAGDAKPNDGERVNTYKNGVRFSTVSLKAAMKLKTHDYHSPVVADPGEEKGAAEAEAESPTDQNPVQQIIAHIHEGKSFLGAKQALRSKMKDPMWATLPDVDQKVCRMALWERYEELTSDGVEDGNVTVDFTLMRLFLEFGAQRKAEIDAIWPKFWKSPTFRGAIESDKDAITALKEERKAALG